MSSADLLRTARIAAGLSSSEVARRAGVSTTTVTRIESGEMDPTVTMLARLLSAVDRQLTFNVEELSEVSLSRLFDAWTVGSWGQEIDWTRLRSFVDYMAFRPELLEGAISTPPRRSGFELLDVLLAAIAEKLADDSGIDRPRWCLTVPAHTKKVMPPGTPRMAEAAVRRSPTQFRKRNIYLSADEVWRHRTG